MANRDPELFLTHTWHNYHAQPVHSLSVSPLGCYLAAASIDGSVSIMNLKKNVPLHMAHFDPGTFPLSVTWISATGLVIIGSDGLVVCVDVHSTTEASPLSSSFIAVADRTTSALQVGLTLSTWLPIYLCEPVTYFASSPSGSTYALCHGNKVELWSHKLGSHRWIALYEASIGAGDTIIGIWFLTDEQLMIGGTSGVYTWVPNKETFTVPVLAAAFESMETATWSPVYGYIAVANSQGSVAMFHVITSPTIRLQQLAVLRQLPSIVSIRIVGPREMLYENLDGDAGEIHRLHVGEDNTTFTIGVLGVVPVGVITFDVSPLGTSIAVAIKSDGAQTIDVWSTVGDNGPVITSNAFGTLIHRTNLPYEIYQARLVVRIVGRMSLFAPLINWPFQTLSRWVPRATLKKLRPGHKAARGLGLFLIVGWLLSSQSLEKLPDDDVDVVLLVGKRYIVDFILKVCGILVTIVCWFLGGLVTCFSGYIQVGSALVSRFVGRAQSSSLPAPSMDGLMEALEGMWDMKDQVVKAARNNMEI